MDARSKDSFWTEILYSLERAGYVLLKRYGFMKSDLSNELHCHVGDHHLIRRKEQRILKMAFQTHCFLRKNSDTVSLVEGDKGIVSIVYCIVRLTLICAMITYLPALQMASMWSSSLKASQVF